MAALAVLGCVAAGGAALARDKIAPPEPALNLPKDLFGAGEIAHPPAVDFAKWTETMARYEKERGQERALCEAGDCALLRWREFLATIAKKDAKAQLGAVNDYINRVPYRTDAVNYGVDDYWATPREFFAKGGDCEDYALAKYLSLRALGWPAERLRVVVVHDNARDLVHAALIAYHGGNAYLLDIEIDHVTDHRAVERYVPIFAISETGWWSYQPAARADVAKAAGTAAAGTPAVRAATVGPPTPNPPERRSLTVRQKPGHPARLQARSAHRAPARHAGLPAAQRSPHMKREAPRLAGLVARAIPGTPAVAAAEANAAATPKRLSDPLRTERVQERLIQAAQ